MFKNYKFWLDTQVYQIDKAIDGNLENFENDDDLVEFIAKTIHTILIQNVKPKGTTINSNDLYGIIGKDLIERYVTYMFNNWYEGNWTKEEYIKYIIEELS